MTPAYALAHAGRAMQPSSDWRYGQAIGRSRVLAETDAAGAVTLYRPAIEWAAALGLQPARVLLDAMR